jgi:hypothetical protein
LRAQNGIMFAGGQRWAEAQPDRRFNESTKVIATINGIKCKYITSARQHWR